MGVTTTTVFVVPDDEHGAALREVFRRWTGERLVEPSLWISPADIDTDGAGPPRVTAEVMGEKESTTDDLFRHIGRYRLTTVRIVVAQLFALDDAVVDKDLIAAADAVADALENALPRSHREGGHSSLLWRINVIAPVSGVSQISADALIPRWNFNVVVSTEDRPDADHANIFVRHPGNAVGHLAAALAAVGGVFSGIDQSALETLEDEQSTANGGEISVLRVAVRAVIGDDAETRLAVRTLESVAAEPQGAVAYVEWARTTGNPDRVVDDVLKHLRSIEPWASGQPVISPRSAVSQEPFGRALRSALAFDARLFALVPKWLLMRGKEHLEDVATDAIVGESADAVVRFNPAQPQEMHDSAADYLRRVDAAAIKAETLRAAEQTPAPDARAWAHLRSVVFAAVDGGELPQGIETPRNAGLREVLPARYAVPDPLDTFTGRGRTVLPADVIGARALGDEITANLKRQAAELSAATTAADAAAAESEAAEVARQASEEAAAAAVDAAQATKASKHLGEDVVQAAAKQVVDTKTAHASAAAKALKAQTKADACREKVAAAKQALDVSEAERDAFRVWAQRIGGSVIFKLADDVARRSAEHGARFQQARAQLTISVPEDDSLERAQRSLLRRWRLGIWGWIAAIAVIVGLWGAGSTLPVPAPEDEGFWAGALRWAHDNWLPLALAVSVVALCAVALANHRFYRANRRYVRSVETAAEQRIQASEDVVFNGRESARLAQLGPSLTDWSSIVGWVLHHPHGSVDDLTRAIDETVVETLPAAFAIARASEDDEIPKQTVVRAVRLLYPKGWASRAFDHAYEVHQAEALAADPAGVIAADLDTSESEYGPRRALEQFWSGGHASRALTAQAVDTLRTAIEEEALVLSTRRVRRLGDFGTGETLMEPEFFSGVAMSSTAFVSDLFTETARVEGKQCVRRSTLWLPPGVVTRQDDDIVNHAVGSQAVAVRADVSRKLAVTDLAPFRADADVVAEAMDDDRGGAGTGWA